MLSQTPSQTVGPFFSHALIPSGPGARPIGGNRLADDSGAGTSIRIEGCLLDGAGQPVTDGLIEIWQADHRGIYPDGTGKFCGFGRAATDGGGRFWFQTIKPGSIAPGHSPHVNVAVFARGMLNHAFTRIYFADEAVANAADPVLATVESDRRDTLVAERSESDGPCTYTFTIRLQGEGETVFFDA